VIQPWRLSHRADPEALPLADRHYNRQKVGSPQFVPPGRCMVLLNDEATALWVTSWPFAEFTKHEWAGAWVNSLFRNESDHLSSDMIRAAVAASVAFFGPPPDKGIITFVNADKVRKKRDPGRCYVRAGFHHAGFSKGGLWAFRMAPADMPPACPPRGLQLGLFDVEAA